MDITDTEYQFPFRFTGQKLDPETGLYYYKARYYDPALGRFLQVDPIGYEDQQNLYAYVANDPINETDPTGMCPRCVVSGLKIIKRTVKAKGNVFKAVKDEVASIADAGGTLIDPSASGLEKGAAVFEAVVGFKLPGGKNVPKGAANGDRAGKPFTKKGKDTIDQRNVDAHGQPTCENCGSEVVPGQKSQRGVTPPGNERQRDHIIPKSKGGDGTPENGQVLCRDCNLDKSDKLPD